VRKEDGASFYFVQRGEPGVEGKEVILDASYSYIE